MIKYPRLTLPLREVIENMHADGYVQEAIAAAVGVDQSTVCRELRRRPGAYAARPCRAQGAVTVEGPHDSPAARQQCRTAPALDQ